jgi:hypothetical protein
VHQELYILDHGREHDFYFLKNLLITFSGIHHKKTCSSESDIAQWTETEKFYHANRKYLFPTTPLSLHVNYESKRLFKNPNGGWSDLRDRQLCISFAFKDAKHLSAIDT